MCIHASLYINMNFINKHEYFPRRSPQRYPPPLPLLLPLYPPFEKKSGFAATMYPDFARKKSLRDTIFYSKTKLESSYRCDYTHAVEKKGVGVGVKVTLISCPNY